MISVACQRAPSTQSAPSILQSCKMETPKQTEPTKSRQISSKKRSHLKKSLSSALARARTISTISLPATILGRLQSEKKKNLEGQTPQKKTNKRKKIFEGLTSQKKIKKKKQILERLTPQTNIKKKKILERFTPKRKQMKKKNKEMPTLAEIFDSPGVKIFDSPDGKITTLVRKRAFSQIPLLKRAGEVDRKRNSYRQVRFFWEENSTSLQTDKTFLKGDKPTLLFLEPKSIVQHLWNMQMEDFLQLPTRENIDWATRKTSGRKIIFTFDHKLWPKFCSLDAQNAVFPPTTTMQLTDKSKTASIEESNWTEPTVASDDEHRETDRFENNQKHNMSDLPSGKSEKPEDVSLPCVWGMLFLSLILDLGYG